MTHHQESIQKAIAPWRQEIIHHQVYSRIKGVEELKVFMQHHVFAVWDFMSLLKTLQNNLTCTAVPWVPKGDAETRFLINEIVTGEESDVDLSGKRKSHFELYLDAMHQCGASTSAIDLFIQQIRRGDSPAQALKAAKAGPEIEAFVNFTFDMIHSNALNLQAAVFTYGREDLIPDMFLSLVGDLKKNGAENIGIFNYYLERHIEVDGGHHGHLAMSMLEHICGSNDVLWQEAEQAVVESLQKRIGLWDGVCRMLG
jgi:hypothetical protein